MSLHFLILHNNKHIEALKSKLGKDQLSIARAPGRISFSKHCDYVNNDLMYFADDRSTYTAVSSKPGTGIIKFSNLDPNYPSFASNNLVEDVQKNSWLSYPMALLKILRDKYSLSLSAIDLDIVVSSDIPAAGGLSSSHALLLSLVIAIASELKHQYLLELINNKSIDLLKILQEVETLRGFNSGLGDPAAQTLSKPDHFVFVRLEPFSYSYLPMPAELAIITAPSFIHADKSLPEFAEANANIAAYKTLNDLSQKLFETKYIGDALYTCSEDDIKSKINSIEDLRLRGLAIYALAEGARVQALKNNAASLSSQDLLKTLGDHLNLSHAAERQYRDRHAASAARDDKNVILSAAKDPYASDHDTRCTVYNELSLSMHSGLYGASTQANDQLQALALSLDGVYGSSISGAGLGGNNIILTTKDKANVIKQELINHYYLKCGLAELAQQHLHISQSSAAAGLI